MTRHISSEKARANWREVLDAVADGETVVIERYGQPVATLTPYSATAPSVREPAPVYDTQALAQLKAEIVAEVIAKLDEDTLEPLAWRDGLAEVRRLEREAGSSFATMTTNEIVEKMRETRRELLEAEYAHLYR